MNRWGAAAIAAVAVVVLDRFTKVWAEATLPGSPMVIVDGWLAFQYAENPGAAFGLFQNAGPTLAVVAIGAIIAIGFMVRASHASAEAAALGMIAGGAAGNLIDRVVRGPGWFDGAVVDFIKIPVIPNFNVADAALTVGVVALLVVSLVVQRDAV